MDHREEFFEEHGHYVNSEGFYIFADGATLEDTSYGRMSPPPEDEWEKAQLIEKYWLTVCQSDEQHFLDFKNYLAGTGRREAAWATLYTEADQLAHLKTLQTQCKRSRAKYYVAKRKAKAAKPFWIEEREAQDIDDARRKQEFQEKVDSFQL